MKYRKDKYGNELSILGYGCLRFPKIKGKIDMAETEKQIMQAIEAGINYFDTAYIYGGSEAALGEILEKNHARDKVKIATKLPYYLIKSRQGLEKLFQEELKRLRTDHVDYYLMHMLSEVDAWERLKKLGMVQWLQEKQRNGQIGQVGFSYHGNTEKFCQVLDAYDWDFCQIQYNYLDEHTQAGRKGLHYANSKGIPVIIMEPLRGGRLVDKLPEKAKKLFAEYPVKRTPAQWGLLWLWDQPEVTVVLSGMNTETMIRENIDAAETSEIGSLGEAERKLYAGAVEAIHETVKVGCTACGYCQPCPKGVDIPVIFATYNRFYAENKKNARKEYLRCTTLKHTSTAASQCIGCGKCESHCPQGIPVRQMLKDVEKTFEGPMFKITGKVVKWFGHF